MKKLARIHLFSISLFLSFQSVATAQSLSERIESATSPLPEHFRDTATVIDRQTRETLREGTNGYICLTDTPSRVYNVRCYDERFSPWLNRIRELRMSGVDSSEMNRITYEEIESGQLQAPPAGAMDYYRTGPSKDESSPLTIVMLGDRDITGFLTEPDAERAWVMCAGTPMAHIMIGLQLYNARSRGISPEAQCGLPEK